MLPGVPNGTPQVITGRWPSSTSPRSWVSRQAFDTISVNSVTSGVTIGWTLQHGAMRRAVSIFGIKEAIGTGGRWRAGADRDAPEPPEPSSGPAPQPQT